MHLFLRIIEQSVNGKRVAIGGENPLIQGKVVFVTIQQVKILKSAKDFHFVLEIETPS